MKLRRVLQSFTVLTVSIFIAACGGGGGNNGTSSLGALVASLAQLNGTFAFSVTGTDPSDGDYFIAGTFTADGKGNITNGLEDLNLGSGVDSSVQFTGTYQVANSLVTVIVNDGTGTPTFFSFPVPASGSVAITTYDGTGKGTLQAQSASGFSNVGNFAFNLQGEGAGTVTASGSFTVGSANAVTNGTESYQDGNFYSRSTSSLGGVLSPAFGGRGTAVIGSNVFSYYVVSQNQIILAGLEDSTLIYGTATKQ